ncbi:MAG: nucleoside deaminase [Candidatus Aenigmarchaeota archaeon]|nr:nucleoside deaminase [Candidatus Aenigmarchaeota archaeon]
MDQDEEFMGLAMQEARKALTEGNYPAGTVIIKNGEIVGSGWSEVLSENDPTQHGEMIAIRNACRRLQSRFLTGCTLYTTVEPCLMCAQALLYAKIGKVVYGAQHREYGVTETFSILEQNGIGRRLQVRAGILKDEADRLLKKYAQR